MTVLPFGKSAVISGSMLGLGRALGETMAVTIILSVSGIVTFNLISQENPSTIAANIALNFPESSGVDVNALIASGLVLFGDHPGRQHDRPRDHLPLERPIDGDSMAETPPREDPAAALRPGERVAALGGPSVSGGTLPAWFIWAVGAARP